MNYFNEAFGGFNPQKDKDASLKLILDSLFSDHRLDDVAVLLPENSEIGCIEGQPGWLIERRDPGDIAGYEDWPPTAVFRTFVDPEYYRMNYPEFFCNRQEILKYVRNIFRIYTKFNHQKSQIIESLKHLLSSYSD